jgi:carbamoyl-phosphate synthase large subunit
MKKINILVLGVGGNVSQGILKALAMTDISYRLVTACVDSSSLGLYAGDKAYLSPYANDDSFVPWLINLCNDESIDLILTGVEEIIEVICLNSSKIEEETSAICVFSDKEKLQVGNDKYLTCKWLKEHNCNYPRYARSNHSDETETLIKEVGFPLIAKPRKGKGSQGIIILNNLMELEKVVTLDNYVIQEYIGSEASEYTVGCYCDKDGKLLDCIILHRQLKYGTTFKATVIEDERIKKEAFNICSQFKPKGPLNIQLRTSNDGRPVCFELNVRFSGTTPIRARFGFNDIEALIREYIFQEPIDHIFHVTKGTVYRYWDEFYISEEMQKVLDNNKVVENVKDYGNFTEGFNS